MSKRRSKRPSPGPQLGKPSGSDPFNRSPFLAPSKSKEPIIDPVLQMPGVMGQPPRGRGYIPFSGGPKVKIGDKVGPPEAIIKEGNNSANQPRTGGGNKPLSGKKVRGNYSNPMDFVKPSDFLTPIFGQPQKLPGPTEPYGPEDRRYGPYDTRPKPKRQMKRVPDVPPVPLPPKQEANIEPPHSPSDDGTVGVYYYDNGRFLRRGISYGKTSRTTQRRG